MAAPEAGSQIRKYGVQPMVSLDRGTTLNVRFLGADQKAKGPETSQASGHIAFRLLSNLAGAKNTGQALQRVAEMLPQVLTAVQQAGRTRSGRVLTVRQAPIDIQDAFKNCYSQPEYGIKQAGYRVRGQSSNEVVSVEACYPFRTPRLEPMQTVYQVFKKLFQQSWDEECCRKALMTLGGNTDHHTLLVIWQNGTFLFVDTLSHGGFKLKGKAPAAPTVHGKEDAYCAVADDWPKVQSYLRYLCDERRGWGEAGLPVEDMELIETGVKSWDSYRIEVAYFLNKGDKGWEEQGVNCKDCDEGGAEQLLRDVHAAESGDPYSFVDAELGGQDRNVSTALNAGAGLTAASRYGRNKSNARKKGEEMTAEFRRIVEKLDVSTQEAQRAFEVEIRRVEQRTISAQKKKSAELVQKAEAKGRQTADKLYRELAQAQESALGLERKLEDSKRLTKEVYQYEQVRAELTLTKAQVEQLKQVFLDSQANLQVALAAAQAAEKRLPKDRSGKH